MHVKNPENEKDVAWVTDHLTALERDARMLLTAETAVAFFLSFVIILDPNTCSEWNLLQR